MPGLDQSQPRDGPNLLVQARRLDRQPRPLWQPDVRSPSGLCAALYQLAHSTPLALGVEEDSAKYSLKRKLDASRRVGQSDSRIESHQPG